MEWPGHWWGTLLDVSVRALLERVSNEKDSHWKWPASPMTWEPGRNKEGKENASRMLPAQPQVGVSLCHVWDMAHTWGYGIMDCMGHVCMQGYRIMDSMGHVKHAGLQNHEPYEECYTHRVAKSRTELSDTTTWNKFVLPYLWQVFQRLKVILWFLSSEVSVWLFFQQSLFLYWSFHMHVCMYAHEVYVHMCGSVHACTREEAKQWSQMGCSINLLP